MNYAHCRRRRRCRCRHRHRRGRRCGRQRQRCRHRRLCHESHNNGHYGGKMLWQIIVRSS